MSVSRCPDTVENGFGGHGPTRSDGRCPWCNAKTGNALSTPDGRTMATSQLTLYYRYHYDPDFGNDEGRDPYL